MLAFQGSDQILISGYQQFRVNITNEIVEFAGFNLPTDFRALVPQGMDWPDVDNVDNIPDFCERRYGTFVEIDAPFAPYFFFRPNDTSKVEIGALSFENSEKGCLQSGDYLFFSAVTDLSRHPEYFSGRFIFNEQNLLREIYEQMNRSLYKKLELFRPAIVHITE